MTSRDRAATRSSATPRPRRSSATTARSTGCACPASTPARASPRCSATSDNGHWRIGPASGGRATRRRYRDGTLVLETEWDTPEGTVRVVDCMPVRDQHIDVVRIVEGVSGRVPMTMDLIVRFDYGSDRAVGARVDGGSIHDRRRARRAVPDARRCELEGRDFRHVAEFIVRRGRPGAVRAHRVPVVPEPLPRADRRRPSASRAPPSAGSEWSSAVARTTASGPTLVQRSLDHAQGAHVRADRRHRRRAHDVAARVASAACATGTTATAGCATRRSRSTR